MMKRNLCLQAKIKEHEPTAVSRDASDREKITEEGQTGAGSIATKMPAEKARRSGMTKDQWLVLLKQIVNMN